MEAINELKRLGKSRSAPSFWSQNIIDAHELCKNETDHRHFYAFMTDPHNYDPTKVGTMKTLGDRVDEPDFHSDIKELPDALTQDVYKNGNEVFIRTRRKETDPTATNRVTSGEHDEKAET
jgi:hypothetical protein